MKRWPIWHWHILLPDVVRWATNCFTAICSTRCALALVLVTSVRSVTMTRHSRRHIVTSAIMWASHRELLCKACSAFVRMRFMAAAICNRDSLLSGITPTSRPLISVIGSIVRMVRIFMTSSSISRRLCRSSCVFLWATVGLWK